MPTVKVVATEYMDPAKTDGFAFDFTHLPPMNDKNVVEKYEISLFWYQTRTYSSGENFDGYYVYPYHWKNNKWEYITYHGEYWAGGSKGWRSDNLTRYSKPPNNKIGGAIQYNYFDRSLGTSTSPYININYTLKSVKVTLENATNKKENEDVILNWASDATQKNYEVRYTNDGITKTLTGTAAQSVSINKYTLKPGKLEYEVRVSNGYNWSDWAKGNIDILEYPIHLTLEPNKIAQNKDKPIVVMWSTSDTQTQYRLKYKQGSNTNTISGTTATFHTFPANFFGNGNVELTLEVYNGYVWVTKTAEFMAFGAPPNPTLTTQATYATATPSLTWSTNEQVSYRVQILKDDIVVLDSSDIYSANKSHKFVEVLENNTTYVTRLRIRNQYEIESDWVSKTFTVAFTELQKPNFDMFGNDNLGTIMFNIYNAVGQSNFKSCEVLRREYGQSTWNKLISNLPLVANYTDYTPKSNVLYEYKVRAIGTNGGYTDSEIGLKEVSLRNTMISDTTDFDSYVVLIHNPKKARTYKNEIHAMTYSGITKPRFEFGDTGYVGMSISFKMDRTALERLEDLYYSNNILMLRDNRGKRLFGYITSDLSVTDADFMKYDVSFNFTETEYIEGVLV